MKINTPVTQHEVELGEHDTIITKTDLKGIITFVNQDFCRISGFSESELLGKNHNIVRHPDMPPAAFEDLWATLKQGKPWNGLVKNRCKNGDFYWVDAYVSPTEQNGRIVGYTSMRTKPDRERIAAASELYRQINAGTTRLGLKGGQVVNRSLWHRANPVSWIRGFSGPSQLLLLILSFVLTYMLQGAMNHKTLREVQVNGPVYHQIELQKDFIADILPPPLYLLESWQVVLEMLVADHAELAGLVEKSRQLREVFESRHRYWQDNMPEGRLKTLVVEQVWNSGRKFLDLRDRQFIPALLSGNRDQALAALPAMKVRYGEHRRAIDEAVAIAGEEYQALRSAALQTVADGYQILIGLGLLTLAVVAVMGHALFRNLTQAGDSLYAAEVIRHIATGNLAIGIKSSAGGSNMLATLKALQSRLRQLVGLISENSRRVAAESSQMAAAAHRAAASTESQLASVAASTEQLTASIVQIACHAQEALGISEQSSASCQQGVAVINKAVSGMQQIAATVRESSETVMALGAQSGRISSVVQAIRGIADQTNLLALNAAIEAARAGEQGRGFAVVADEVRKLAERTSHATREIEEMIGSIQVGLQSAVSSMESGVHQVDGGVVLANEAGESIEKIRAGAVRVAKVVAEITGALDEQRSTCEHMSSHVERIVRTSEENRIAAEQVSGSAVMLENTSRQLLGSVSRFMV